MTRKAATLTMTSSSTIARVILPPARNLSALLSGRSGDLVAKYSARLGATVLLPTEWPDVTGANGALAHEPGSRYARVLYPLSLFERMGNGRAEA
jgi:hypothetical protein